MPTNMKSLNKSKIINSILTALLPAFMLFLFGPTEIFFGNSKEFSFVFSEFIGLMIILFIVVLIVLSAILIVLPERVGSCVSAVITAISVAGYIQVMFLNKNLDLLGVNPEGNRMALGQGIINLLIWLAILIAFICFAIIKKDAFNKSKIYIVVCLLLVQIVAFSSLMLTGDRTAFERPEGEVHLSGKEEMTVSSDKNVIIFILDFFSNSYRDRMLAQYPDAELELHDFTYYNNANCNYYGTFPSIAHMLSGSEVDTSSSITQWFDDIWSSEKAENFYSALHENGYIFNIYTHDNGVLMDASNPDKLMNKFDNLTTEPYEFDINSRLMMKTLSKMSAYRMAPDLLKNCFYTNVSEYDEIVKLTTDAVDDSNYDFYERLETEGLSKKEGRNRVIYYHLIGTHEYATAYDGTYKEDSTLEETAKGCMTIISEYIRQLKELGVYDDATIIITSDHGSDLKDELQIIYYLKKPNETHEVSPITSAPYTHCDMLPTIAASIGMDSAPYGTSVYELHDGDLRERKVWVRTENEPGYQNDVYRIYTYTGDNLALITQVDLENYEVEEMLDMYY